MTRPRTVLAIGVALAVAVASGLLGIAALRAQAETEQRWLLAARAPGVEDPAIHDPSLATRIGESLLGVGDERAYYDAVLLARSADLASQPDAVVAERRAQAQAILARLVHNTHDPALRSRAWNLLGALLFEDAKVVRENPRRFLEQAYGAFQDAVLADPSNVAAKRNLELLSTLPLRTQFRRQTSSGTEASASGGGESGY